MDGRDRHRFAAAFLSGCVVAVEIRKHSLSFGCESRLPALPHESNNTGMQGVVRKDEPGALLIRQPIFHQRHIQVFVAAIELVAYNRMTEVGKMNADFMLPTSVRDHAKQRKGSIPHLVLRVEPPLDPVLGPRRRSIEPYAIFNGNSTLFVFAE